MDLPTTNHELLRKLGTNSRRDKEWIEFDKYYRDVILTWCEKRGLSQAQAEDATQDILLKLTTQIRSYDSAEGRFRSWLKAVVNNALTDAWRRFQDRDVEGVGTTDFQQWLNNIASPEALEELGTTIERSEKAAAEVVQRVRVRIGEESWQAFWSLKMEDRTFDEVAKELKIQLPSLYKKIYRIQKMLEEEYVNVYGSPVRQPLPR